MFTSFHGHLGIYIIITHSLVSKDGNYNVLVAERALPEHAAGSFSPSVGLTYLLKASLEMELTVYAH